MDAVNFDIFPHCLMYFMDMGPNVFILQEKVFCFNLKQELFSGFQFGHWTEKFIGHIHLLGIRVAKPTTLIGPVFQKALGASTHVLRDRVGGPL